MLALRSHVVEAAGARSGVEQPGQTIAGRSARRASCAARRQFGRGRAGERRAHRRLAGNVSDFFDASPGDPSLLFTFTAVDEDVTAASALRHLTLETQSRGKLHAHGILGDFGQVDGLYTGVAAC